MRCNFFSKPYEVLQIVLSHGIDNILVEIRIFVTGHISQADASSHSL